MCEKMSCVLTYARFDQSINATYFPTIWSIWTTSAYGYAIDKRHFKRRMAVLATTLECILTHYHRMYIKNRRSKNSNYRANSYKYTHTTSQIPTGWTSVTLTLRVLTLRCQNGRACPATTTMTMVSGLRHFASSDDDVVLGRIDFDTDWLWYAKTTDSAV